MVLENIISMFGDFWGILTQLIFMIMLIMFTVVFFVVEYYLLLAYIWVFKKLWNFPLTEIIIYYIIETVLNVKINPDFKKYLPSGNIEPQKG